ncbi:MAG: carboxypeptidase-like regulatory domain-containing protein, partial [Methylocystis sp.]|nr:carboxypeptidase-like regulatory domain-containing protein [Methylocystis sp.]
PSEAAFIKTPGKGQIEGQALLQDRQSGGVRHAAGEVVRLIPASSYAQQRIAHFYGGGKFVPAHAIPKIDPDPDYVSYTRTTKTGPTGRFVFDNVAPGRYFLTTQLIWKPKDSFVSEGGAMYEEVSVTGQETGPVRVILSGN